MDIQLIARGGVPVKLDRSRLLFFDTASTWALYLKHGPDYLLKLIGNTPGEKTLFVRSEAALIDLLMAGLQRDAEQHNETLSEEQVRGFVHPFNMGKVAGLVIQALGRAVMTEAVPGKAVAAGDTPAGAAADGPGPAKVTTMSKRSASPSERLAGPPRSSGPRRSVSSTSRTRGTSKK